MHFYTLFHLCVIELCVLFLALFFVFFVHVFTFLYFNGYLLLITWKSEWVLWCYEMIPTESFSFILANGLGINYIKSLFDVDLIYEL